MMQIIRIALSLEAMQNEPKLVAGKCPHTEIQSCSNRRTDTNESALPEVSYNVQIIATFYEPLNVNIERLLKAQEKGQTRCFIEVQSSSRRSNETIICIPNKAFLPEEKTDFYLLQHPVTAYANKPFTKNKTVDGNKKKRQKHCRPGGQLLMGPMSIIRVPKFISRVLAVLLKKQIEQRPKGQMHWKNIGVNATDPPFGAIASPSMELRRTPYRRCPGNHATLGVQIAPCTHSRMTPSPVAGVDF
ncbi:hypothetical protein HUJ05_004807 [Dendroctonus ponderosae]|nr:hypothetical protein HUJ05_004807 [Dendroctonus ponderosae]